METRKHKIFKIRISGGSLLQQVLQMKPLG